jgi:S-adenosylmethionine synthetase
MRLLPRDTSFFDHFEEQGRKTVEGCRAFLALIDDPANAVAHAKKIKQFEEECDSITHRVVESLHKTQASAKRMSTADAGQSVRYSAVFLTASGACSRLGSRSAAGRGRRAAGPTSRGHRQVPAKRPGPTPVLRAG